MSVSKELAMQIAAQLDLNNDITYRAMFGGYAIYCDLKVVGLIVQDQLYIKATDSGEELLGSSVRLDAPYPGAKPWFHISTTLLSDKEHMSQLVRVTADSLPPPKPKKKRKPRSVR